METYLIPCARPVVLREVAPLDRPATKLSRLGVEALSDLELLTVVLSESRDDQAAADRAARLVEAGYPQGNGWREVIKGAARARLDAVSELGRRASKAPDGRAVLDSPARALEYVPPEVRAAKKEHLLAFYLNARSQLVHMETVSVGTLSASLVHPREVFAPAIAHAAAALIVCHNHPSGDTTPSAEDRDATRRLSRAGELLGVPLLDHLIVSERGFFSFKEHGLLGAV